MFAAVSYANSRRNKMNVRKQADFSKAREHLKRHRGALASSALRGELNMQWDPAIPLLTAVGWIPERPLKLSEVTLSLARPTNEQLEDLNLARSKLLRYWPVDNSGHPLESYSNSIMAYDKSTRMEDQPCYRLVKVIADPQAAQGSSLAFTRATYFDGIDTEESLGYEVAIRDLQHSGPPFEGTYRRWLGDPFNLGCRAALPGINTLTIRQSPDGPRFFMHRRGVNAGLAMGVFHVAPAGEFQPQIDDPTLWDSDLSILNNIVREYAEEFLGVTEANGRDGAAIDFDNDLPYKEFLKAYRLGSMKIFYLGTGLDPLTWKPEILTACVFEEKAFNKIFSGMVTDKIDEGTGGVLLAGKARTTSSKASRTYSGIPFNSENIAEFANPTRTSPAGVACLVLSKRWTPEILGYSHF